MLASIGSWLVQLMETVGYPGLIFAGFLENIIPPIPSELIMPLAGYLAAQGKMNIFLVIIFGTLGSSLGTIPFFFIGRYFSRHKISEFVEKYGKYFFFDREKLDNIFDLFNKHDGSRVFFARFLPGARSLISLPAGSANMDLKKFLVLTFAGTAIWTTLWSLIGYYFGQQQEMILSYIDQYEHYGKYVVVGLVIIIIVWAVNRPTKAEK